MVEIESTTYLHKTMKSLFGDREIDYISSMPQYDDQKKEKIRAEVERGLYNVFSKYVSTA